jgi:hypothetical protein
MNLAIPRGEGNNYKSINYKGLTIESSGVLGIKAYDKHHKKIYSMLTNIANGDEEISIVQGSTRNIFSHTPFNLSFENATNGQNYSINGLLGLFNDNYETYIKLFDDDTKLRIFSQDKITDLVSRLANASENENDSNYLTEDEIKQLSLIANIAVRVVANILLKNFNKIYEEQSCFVEVGGKITFDRKALDEIVGIPGFYSLLNAVSDTTSAVNTKFDSIMTGQAGFSGIPGIKYVCGHTSARMSGNLGEPAPSGITARAYTASRAYTTSSFGHVEQRTAPINSTFLDDNSTHSKYDNFDTSSLL